MSNVIFDLLSAKTSITDLVGDRIYPGDEGEGLDSSLGFIKYQTIDERDNIKLNSIAKKFAGECQIKCVAKTLVAAQAIADAVRALSTGATTGGIQGHRDSIFQGVFCDGELFDTNAEQSVIEFQVRYFLFT